MARQQVEPSAELWFITARDTEHVRAIATEPRVALTFSSRSAWVALEGRAAVVDDQAKLKELWNTFAEAWLPGGPEDDNATLIRVDVEQRGVLGHPRQQAGLRHQLRQEQGDRRALRQRPRHARRPERPAA